MRGPCNIVQEEASTTLLPRFEKQRGTLDSIMFMCNKFYIHIVGKKNHKVMHPIAVWRNIPKSYDICLVIGPNHPFLFTHFAQSQNLSLDILSQ